VIGATAALWRCAGDADRRFRCGAGSGVQSADRDAATAINLKWRSNEMRQALAPLAASAAARRRMSVPGRIAEQDVAINREIAQHGLALIEAVVAKKQPGQPVNILKHCNAGWLATGTGEPRRRRYICP